MKARGGEGALCPSWLYRVLIRFSLQGCILWHPLSQLRTHTLQLSVWSAPVGVFRNSKGIVRFHWSVFGHNSYACMVVCVCVCVCVFLLKTVFSTINIFWVNAFFYIKAYFSYLLLRQGRNRRSWNLIKTGTNQRGKMLQIVQGVKKRAWARKHGNTRSLFMYLLFLRAVFWH